MTGTGTELPDSEHFGLSLPATIDLFINHDWQIIVFHHGVFSFEVGHIPTVWPNLDSIHARIL